jgi:hypothetical protein
VALAGDGVERLAGVHRAPHHGQPGARVDPAVQQRRHVDDHPAQRVHQVGGQVRAGGVPAGAGQRHLDGVGGGGERAGPHADQAGRELRVAVQRVDRGDVLERAGLDHLGGAGRHALLGGLEDQPHPAGQLALLVQLRQGQAEAEQHGGVHVVAAGVRDVRDGGAVRHVLGVLQRQRVQVGAERHHPVAGADVAEQAVALGQQLRGQAGHGQLTGDQRGGLELRVRHLRVRVDVPADGYQLGPVGGEPAVQLAGQWVRSGRRAREGRHLDALRHRQSTRHVGFTVTFEKESGFRNARQPSPILVTLCNVIFVRAGLRNVTKGRSGRHDSPLPATGYGSPR